MSTENRLNIRFTEQQIALLKARSATTGLPVVEVVRELVDKLANPVSIASAAPVSTAQPAAPAITESNLKALEARIEAIINGIEKGARSEREQYFSQTKSMLTNVYTRIAADIKAK